jgi:uncharacterized repeat protein (TIGR03803 family)
VKKNQSYRMLTVILSLTVVFASKTGYAQTFSVLYNFGGVSGDPTFPQKQLSQGGDGALYGTSNTGGANGSGSIFKLNAAGKVNVVYSFCAQSGCPDGSLPQAGLTLRPDGHFLGAAAQGGTSNAGTIFDITESGGFTLLYSFTGGADGAGPDTPPIIGPDGHFYGVAFVGGGSSCGTAYRLTPAPTGTSAVFTPLHKFAKAKEGCNPTSLVLGTDGNLYGTNSHGGSAGFGTVFKMTPSGAVTLLHTFSGLTDGSIPLGLTLGNDGNFYGVAAVPSTGPGGVIFKITPDGIFTVLHTMNDADGNGPKALFQASDGNFYGAAAEGGTSTNCFFGGTNQGCGTLFEITPAGDFTVLYNFDLITGQEPVGGLQQTSGLLYGNTVDGGTNCCGVLYSLNNGLPPYAALIPGQAKVGTPVEILGQGFTSSTSVSFNGMPAATVKVSSPTRLLATVPSGATTGFVTVTTSSGTLSSIQPFVVAP